MLAVAILATPARCAASDGAALLEQAGVGGGLVVHLGCREPEKLAQLRPGPQFYVHGLDTSAEAVAAAREQLLQRGVYGPVSVDRWDGEHLPYADNMVNMLVAGDPGKASQEEMFRVLTPGGVLLARESGHWRKTVKPWPEQMDQWTHYLHGSDGNPVSSDTMVGPPERLQWIGSPAWSRHHDHMASLTSMVSANGRLFYIIDEGSRASIQLPARWQLVARDAFNGVILWKRELGRWNTKDYPLKSGPAHLLRRLVAVGDRVYVTLDIDGPASVLDAVTGRTLLELDGSRFTREIVVAGSTVLAVADTSPSTLPDFRRVSTYVWENTRVANAAWGWDGKEQQILAYDAESGRPLWKADSPVSPCSLVADAEHVVFHTGKQLVCLDRSSGRKRWSSQTEAIALPVHTNTGPRIVLYDNVVLYAEGDRSITGWSLADGHKLWEQKKWASGHMSLRDLLIADGLVWTGALAGNTMDGLLTGYDPVTGEKKREFLPDVNVHWFHHRCYPAKGAAHYLITGRNGTEFVDLRGEHWKPHHWVRGGCIYGVMPCNGLLYAPMDACGCQLEAKLSGLKALAGGPAPQPGPEMTDPAARLEKGPAYGQVTAADAAPGDWPTYRHDYRRSGSSDQQVALDAADSWQAQLGGRLSAPTIAAGMVFVAAVDAHTLHALDAASGRRLWSYTAGGRIDSPPTYYQGLVLFGSADGYVYALRAADGVLVWRFRAAPIDRRIMAWEQLESVWPVHGSVLVYDGVLYCTAGRSMFLDGGIHFLRLDPTSGRLLGQVVMDDKDPESGQDVHLAYCRQTQGNNMPVALNDILSCDGRHIWLRSQKIDFEGNRSEIALRNVAEQPADDCHLFCQVGFLDDSYFFRSYWTFGRRVTGGYGGWMQAGWLVPSGRILCFDDERVYGFGRKPEFMTNASVLQYQIFSADKTVNPQAIEHVQRAQSQINRRSPYKNGSSSDWLLRHFFPTRDLSAVNFRWIKEQPAILGRAMAASRDVVFVAGPPVLIDERQAYRMPDDPQVQALLKKQDEAFQGRYGGELWALAKADGSLVARYQMDSIPVFDSLAIAGGRLFVSTVDGRVLCLSGARGGLLRKVSDRPEQILWNQPEDSGYLLPEEQSKDADFDTVNRCHVVAGELGYRIRPVADARQIGLALKKLPQPATGRLVLKARLQVPQESQGGLRNGFLVFGDGARDDRLIKCGVRLKVGKAFIIQGPLAEGSSKGVALAADEQQPWDLVVTVDLAKQQVTLAVGGATVQTPLQSRLQQITHVGYATDNAVVDFSPLQIEAD